MRLESLRWVFLPAALLGLAAILWRGASTGRVCVFALSALAWYFLSRRKALSLDRRGPR